MPEAQFVASHPGPVSLSVTLPNDATNAAWRLNGQTISVMIDIGANVKALKQQIGDMQGGMPASKMQIRHPIHGFLKDTMTLGHYNLLSGTVLQLSVRSRGRK